MPQQPRIAKVEEIGSTPSIAKVEEIGTPANPQYPPIVRSLPSDMKFQADPGFFSSLWTLLKGAAVSPSPVMGIAAEAALHPTETRAVINQGPVVGGIVGGTVGGIPGAIIGGAGGQLLKRLAQTQTEPGAVPTTRLGAAADVGSAGAIQGLIQSLPFTKLLGRLGANGMGSVLQRTLAPAANDLQSEAARVLSDREGLNLSLAETAGKSNAGYLARQLQKIAQTSVFGRPVAQQAQDVGNENAQAVLQRLTRRLTPDVETLSAKDAGRAIQGSEVDGVGIGGIRGGGELFQNEMGRRLEASEAALAPAQVDIRASKAEAQRLLDEAGKVNKFLNDGGGLNDPDHLAVYSALLNQGYDPQLARTMVEGAAKAGATGFDGTFREAMRQGALGNDAPAKAISTEVVGQIDPLARKVLSDFSKLPDTVPFEIANAMKKRLNKLTPAIESIFGKEGPAMGQHMNHLLTTDMMQGALGHDATKAAEWKAAREFASEGYPLFAKQASAELPAEGQFVNSQLNDFSDKLLGKINSQGEAEAVVNAITKYAKYGTPEQQAQQMASLGKLQRGFAEQRLFRNEQGQLDVYGIKKRMEGFGDEMLKSIYNNTPEGRYFLSNVNLVADAMSRVQKVNGLNPMLTAALWHALAAAPLGLLGLRKGDWKGAAGMTIALEAMPFVLTRAMYSRVASQALADGIEQIGTRGSAALPNIVRAFQLALTDLQQKPAQQPIRPVPRKQETQ